MMGKVNYFSAFFSSAALALDQDNRPHQTHLPDEANWSSAPENFNVSNPGIARYSIRHIGFIIQNMPSSVVAACTDLEGQRNSSPICGSIWFSGGMVICGKFTYMT